ncbi:MAG: GNAT family N-acetyltransferase [Rhizobiales bacterium]|nr:GNAT family N-acetyltransferase [Hyphomicrobiales bacterium]
MAAKFSLRPATRKDAVDLAILMDMASRGLVNWVWSTMAEPGQSALEVGRDRILNRADLPSHFSRWRVAEHDGATAGGYAGYVVPDPYDPGDVSELPDVYGPLLELEALAAGSWFLMAIGVYPEFRREGLGSMLLESAIGEAREAGVERISLTVSTANDDALRLYQRNGFREIARRGIIVFPSSGEFGDWVLLGQAVSVGTSTVLHR